MAETPQYKRPTKGRAVKNVSPFTPGEPQVQYQPNKPDNVDRNWFDKIIVDMESGRLPDVAANLTKGGIITNPGAIYQWNKKRQDAIKYGTGGESLDALAAAAPRYGISPDLIYNDKHEPEVAAALQKARDDHIMVTGTLRVFATMAQEHGDEPNGLERWLEEVSVENGWATTPSVALMVHHLNEGADFYDRMGEPHIANAVRNVANEITSEGKPESVARLAAIAFWDDALSSSLSNPAIASDQISNIVGDLSNTVMSRDSASTAWRAVHQWFGDHVASIDPHEVRELDLSRAGEYRGSMRASPSTRFARPEVLLAVSRDIANLRPELSKQLFNFANQVSLVADDNPTTIATYADFLRLKTAMNYAKENIRTEALRYAGQPRPEKEKGSWFWPNTYVHNMPASLGAKRDMIQRWGVNTSYENSIMMAAPMGIPDMILTPMIAKSGLAGKVDEEEMSRLLDEKMEKSPMAAAVHGFKGEKYDRHFGEYMSHFPDMSIPVSNEAVATAAKVSPSMIAQRMFGQPQYRQTGTAFTIPLGLSRGAGGHITKKGEIAAGFLEMVGTMGMFHAMAEVPGVSEFGQAQMLSMGPDDWSVMGPIMGTNKALKAVNVNVTPLVPQKIPKPIELGSFPIGQLADLSRQEEEKPLVAKKKAVPPPMPVEDQ